MAHLKVLVVGDLVVGPKPRAAARSETCSPDILTVVANPICARADKILRLFLRVHAVPRGEGLAPIASPGKSKAEFICANRADAILDRNRVGQFAAAAAA